MNKGLIEDKIYCLWMEIRIIDLAYLQLQTLIETKSPPHAEKLLNEIKSRQDKLINDAGALIFCEFDTSKDHIHAIVCNCGCSNELMMCMSHKSYEELSRKINKQSSDCDNCKVLMKTKCHHKE